MQLAAPSFLLVTAMDHSHSRTNKALPCASMRWLNDDMLRVILMLLPQNDRWRDLMDHPMMWPVVDVTPRPRGIYYPSSLVPITNMDVWLRHRSAGIQEFTLRLQDNDTMLVQPALQSIAVGATQLQQLQIRTKLSDYSHVYFLRAKHLECVSWLPPCLTRLDLAYVGAPVGQPGLDVLFSNLPALEFVRLHFQSAFNSDGFEYYIDSDNEQQQRDHTQQNNFPLSLLRCTRLTHLDLTMLEVEAPTDIWSVGGLPEGITALQRLQHLRLGNCVTAPLTHGISRLTQLTCLEIAHGELLDFTAPADLVPLPASLGVLRAFSSPMEVLAQLTALEALTLMDITSNAAAATCSVSVLQRLRRLHLGRAGDVEMDIIGACTGLRTLCLGAVRLGDGPVPLRYPQLTRLQLLDGAHLPADLLDTVAELDQLEILEVLRMVGDIDTVTARELSRLPKLRTVNLSHSLLCAPDHEAEPLGRPPWVPICECMPTEVVQRLLRLQKAAPRITWVLAGMGCCNEKPPSRRNTGWDWY